MHSIRTPLPIQLCYGDRSVKSLTILTARIGVRSDSCFDTLYSGGSHGPNSNAQRIRYPHSSSQK
jgi:hypothetical protein